MKLPDLERSMWASNNQADLGRILGIWGDWMDIIGYDCVQCHPCHLLVPVPGSCKGGIP